MCLSVMCVLLVLLSFKFSDRFSAVKTLAGDMISPMQKGINTVGRSISDKLELLSSKEELQAKNKELQEKLDTLSYANKILTSENAELDNLQELYKLDKKYPDYPKVAATIISRDGNNWFNVFYIDKGKEDGVDVDMNVIAGNGLVGIVTEVGDNYSKIRSIIDDTSYVSGMFLKTNDTCTVHGDIELMDKGMIRIEDISIHAQIAENYELVTSYISDKYLPGILIGFVQNIRTDASNMTKEANLLPVVDFEHIENVLIITQLKERIESDGE